VRERIALLADAGEILASSLDYGATLPELARPARCPAWPTSRSWSCSSRTGPCAGRLGPTVTRPRGDVLAEMGDPVPADPGRRPPRGAGHPHRPGPAAGDRRPEIILNEVRSPEHLALLEQVGIPTSALAVPLVARGRTLGALFLMYTESGRRFGAADVAFAEDLARRAAVALDNARLYAERARVARTLQDSLLPHRLPDVDGLEIAARYRPAGGGTDVGGDFYDVFEVAGGSYVVVMGDVCGKGADAAALTGLIRWTVRAAAMRERDPATVLTMLNEACSARPPTTASRRWCARAWTRQPTARASRSACGGHPQPLVLGRRDGRGGGVPGSLIGALEEIEVADRSLELLPGDTVVLFTDGVTEERDDSGRPFGEEGLAGLLERSAGLSAAALAGRIEDEVSAWARTAPRDDIAVLVLRVPPRA
jgi:serine phosphatase RsbU (regulator of sigma subunit)